MRNWLLPENIADILPATARQVESAKAAMLERFRTYGYELVCPPLIEYVDSLVYDGDAALAMKTFKLDDQLSGRQLGVRADITPQVARIDAHLLSSRQGVTRLCYAGSVLHAQPRPLSTSRSPIQLGAELYGDASPASDVEVISLMLDTLALAQVPDVHMDLGHVGIYRGLARAAGLCGELEQQLFDALQRKAIDEVEALTADLPAEPRKMLRALAELCGDRDVLDLAQACLVEAPEEVHVALDELMAIADMLSVRYPELPLYFDLGELRGYHYHTGVVFAAFVPGSGQSIAQGGRYDDIGADFGRARPATGFSTDLKSLVDRGQMPEIELPAGVWAPDSHDLYLWQAVQRLRREGVRVVQALPGQDLAAAHAAGCDRLLQVCDGRWQLAPLAP